MGVILFLHLLPEVVFRSNLIMTMTIFIPFILWLLSYNETVVIRWFDDNGDEELESDSQKSHARIRDWLRVGQGMDSFSNSLISSDSGLSQPRCERVCVCWVSSPGSENAPVSASQLSSVTTSNNNYVQGRQFVAQTLQVIITVKVKYGIL